MSPASNENPNDRSPDPVVRLAGVVVATGAPGDDADDRAETLAARLGVPKLASLDPVRAGLALEVGAGLTLLRRTPAGKRHGTGVTEHRLQLDLQPRRFRELPLVARALGLRSSGEGPATIIDTTAGLGRDSVELAALGAEVTMIERNPVLAELLADALERLRPVAPELAGRIRLIRADARRRLETESADAILIDPMFDAPTKRAAPRLDMQICRALLGDDADDGELEDLLRLACAACRRRVALKRPPRAPTLDSPAAPITTVRGQRVRFDIYAPRPPGGSQTCAT